MSINVYKSGILWSAPSSLSLPSSPQWTWRCQGHDCGHGRLQYTGALWYQWVLWADRLGKRPQPGVSLLFSRSCSVIRTFTSGWNRVRPFRQSMPATNLIHLFIPQAVTDYLHYARHFEVNRVDPTPCPCGAWSLHKERKGNNKLLYQLGWGFFHGFWILYYDTFTPPDPALHPKKAVTLGLPLNDFHIWRLFYPSAASP